MATDYSAIFANAAKGFSGGSSGGTSGASNRPLYSGPNFGYTPQYGSGKGSFGGYASYQDYTYANDLKAATTPGNMSYGKLPFNPNLSWNENMDRQSQFENDFSTSQGIRTGSSAMNSFLGVKSAPATRSSGGGGGGGGGSGGGAISMGQPAPLEFYLGPAPTLTELNLNYEEMGKRAMEANKPFAEQYRQFAPQTEAGARALSQAGSTMATGQLSRDMASQIGRGAAALGFSSGLGGRSGIGRNILARDLGLGSLQVQQQGADLLSKSSMLAQQAMQAMAPIAVGSVFDTAANQASVNQQIANQNLLNAYQTQALPGQFDIKTGSFVGYQPGSRVTTRPLPPGSRKTPFGVMG
jgi:hypothetical protein